MPLPKVNPRVWMGVCSAVGYLIILGIKARQFGWEDIPEYWLWSGVGLAVVMLGVALVHRARGRKAARAELDRIHARAHVRRRSDSPVPTIEPSPPDEGTGRPRTP